jgi:hypothetical protein
LKPMLNISRTTKWLTPLLFLLAFASNSFAGSLDSSVMGMFPKDVAEFGCADLAQAREQSWFPQFEAQLVPVSLFGFEQFLEAAQMRQTSPLEQVAWARVTASDSDSAPSGEGNGQLTAVAIGDFDAGAIKFAANALKVPTVQFENYTLYDAATGSGTGDTFFALVDWRTIAFGPLPQLKRILKIHAGEEDNLLENEQMMTLIDKANGEGIFWGVLNSARAASVIGQLIPEVSAFPQSQDMIGKMKELLIVVKAPSNIQLDMQAASASSNDALLISQLLQAGMLVRQYQTQGQNNPALSNLLGALQISADGNLLDVSLNLTSDQLISLIEHNTFTM